MRVLTFGWEFPPVKIGGLGVACHGLTQELIKSGVEVIFVLPREQEVTGNLRFIFADVAPSGMRLVGNGGSSYMTSSAVIEYIDSSGRRRHVHRSMIDEVHQYAHQAAAIARQEQFDLIHAHDWASYLAGVAAKRATGKPLILHVHVTSYDQAGGDNVDPEIHKIEKEAFAAADQIVTVSNYTKKILTDKHKIDPEKIEVVHNGIYEGEPQPLAPVLSGLKAEGKKIVLFHGRITIQKGVDYFIRAARKVIDAEPDVVFVVSGSGDMEQQIMHLVGSLGLSRHVIFAGSLWDEERNRMYQAADLIVMPSVSEPFGIVPLEAIQQGTPVIISKQSGVSEVLKHALKVDFWDVDEMANKIVATLTYTPMHRQLATESKHEVANLTWKEAAGKVVSLYRRLLTWMWERR